MILINGLHYGGTPPLEDVTRSVLANYNSGINFLKTIPDNINDPHHVKQAVQYAHSAINDASIVLRMLGREPYNTNPNDIEHFTHAVSQGKEIAERLRNKVGTNGHDPELDENDLEVILNGANAINTIFESTKIKYAPTGKYNLISSDVNTGASNYEGTYESLDEALSHRDSNNAKFSSDRSEFSDDKRFNYIWNVYNDKGFVVAGNNNFTPFSKFISFDEQRKN